MSIFKRAPKAPTPAQAVQARIAELTSAMNERRPAGPSEPPIHLRIVSSRSLEVELTDEEEEGDGASS